MAWLREGDVNSRFFHKAIARRRNRNALAGLEIGEWIEEPWRVKEEVRRHFVDHFRRRQGVRLRMPTDLSVPRLGEEERAVLIKPFSEEEVKEAVWECDSSKSPGPDGFNFGFLKRCWNIVKPEVIRMMEEFHSNGRITKGSNSSFIVLIPKRDGAAELGHFRPISLIGCQYKILAKTLAGRMRPVMGQFIGEAQSAFVRGRNIMDGAILLNKIIEDAKKRKVGSLIFKVDFAKAYDSIDWGYLSENLERLGFSEKWKEWMMECVSTATANVLVNGSPSGEFSLERGIRQGDPLSPFLFLAAAEGLNLLTNQAVCRGLLRPVEMGKDRIKVSHLQYADDTLFVVEGSEENVRAIKWILKIFELISGLQVNYDKCRLIGINLPDEEVCGLANLLGCQVGSCPVDYLGLKVGGGLTRLLNWTDLVDKARKRLSGWNAECLSMGGRVTLINSVMTAIPIYRMAFAPIPAGTARTLKSMQIRFMWGEKEGGVKKIAWVKWEDVCRIKSDGGLGVKDMGKFNLAFVGKWWWRALTAENNLWARVVRSRWGGRLWEVLKDRSAIDKKAGSGWWSRIEVALEGNGGRWFTSRLGKKVGDGGNTCFWLDRWCGERTLKASFPRLFQLSQDKDGSISDMGRWENGIWRWNFQWRRALVDREVVMVEEMEKAVEGVKLKEGCSDKWSWGVNSDDAY